MAILRLAPRADPRTLPPMPPNPLRTVLACLCLAPLLTASTQTAPAAMKIFLLIGQSNMAGRGLVEAQDQQPHPRVLTLNKEGRWVPAIERQPS